MKSIVNLIAAGSLLAAAAMAQKPPHYIVTDLGTLPGGAFSQSDILSNNRFVTGVAAINSTTSPQHAVVWYNSGWFTELTDIGTPGLGGPNSSAWGVDAAGRVAVVAESSTKDPNNENFCAYGTGLECLPAVWQAGTMIQLPLLGGNNGSIGNINSLGQVSGFAENSTKDPTCLSGISVSGTGPQVLDFEPVIWGPWAGQIRQLPLLSGDTVGMAFWINDMGQAVGATGKCANTVLPPLAFGSHAVIWGVGGSVTDLGNLGSTVLNAALGINNQGQVVGVSSLTPNATPAIGHDAFLWTKHTGMQDLGKLPGDVASVGQAINDRGEVVGLSLDAMGNPRAFFWENGVMSDFNTLVQANSPLYLLGAETINSSGEIAGFGVTSSGDIHAYVATPGSGNFDDEASLSSPMAFPDGVGKKFFLQRGMRGR